MLTVVRSRGAVAGPGRELRRAREAIEARQARATSERAEARVASERAEARVAFERAEARMAFERAEARVADEQAAARAANERSEVAAFQRREARAADAQAANERVEANAAAERAEARAAFERTVESRQLTQAYSVISVPTATTLLTTRTRPVATQPIPMQREALADGSSLRFLTIGLALGVILAFLLSGHNLVRLRTAIGLAILPASAVEQIQQPQPSDVAVAAQTGSAPMPIVQSPVAFQPTVTQFQPVARTPVVSTAFPIPEVDVAHLPKHNPPPRQASRPRSPKAAAAAPSDQPFDARTIEASLQE